VNLTAEKENLQSAAQPPIASRETLTISRRTLRRLKMDEFMDPSDDALVEIIPPQTGAAEGDQVVCICCQRSRSRTRMDDDACGICEECIAL